MIKTKTKTLLILGLLTYLIQTNAAEPPVFTGAFLNKLPFDISRFIRGRTKQLCIYDWQSCIV
jgi:hypothetical protein